MLHGVRITDSDLTAQTGKFVHSEGAERLPIRQKVRSHIALSLHFHFPSALELVRVMPQDLVHFFRDLSVIRKSSGVHPARDVHRVAPDIVLGLSRADHACHYRADVNT